MQWMTKWLCGVIVVPPTNCNVDYVLRFMIWWNARRIWSELLFDWRAVLLEMKSLIVDNRWSDWKSKYRNEVRPIVWNQEWIIKSVAGLEGWTPCFCPCKWCLFHFHLIWSWFVFCRERRHNVPAALLTMNDLNLIEYYARIWMKWKSPERARDAFCCEESVDDQDSLQL